MSTTPTIEELRRMQAFIPWDEWPNVLRTNSLSFALGLPFDDPKSEFFEHLLDKKPVTKLETLLNSLGFAYRRICNMKELKKNEYGFVLYHYTFKTKRHFRCYAVPYKTEKIHLARIELDGTWTHKFGWDCDASITTPEEIHDIILRDDGVDVSPVAMLAVKRP